MFRASRRRRALPEPFALATAEIAAAQHALLTAVPKPRDDGVPLGVALAAFGAGLRRALDAISTWDDPAASEIKASIEAAREAGEALRLQPGTLGFAALNGAIGEVLAPLEDLVEIERRFR